MSEGTVRELVASHLELEAELLDGRQFRLRSGEILNVYGTGTVTVQGRATPLAMDLRRRLHELGVRLGASDLRVLGETPSGAAGDPHVPRVPRPLAVRDEPPGSQTVPITITGIAGMSVLAIRQMSDQLQNFANRIAAEASRLEEGDRDEATTNPEITATHIADAFKVAQRRTQLTSQPKRSKTYRWIQVAQVSATILTGAMLTLLHSSWQDCLATGSGVLALFSTVYVLVVNP